MPLYLSPSTADQLLAAMKAWLKSNGIDPDMVECNGFEFENGALTVKLTCTLPMPVIKLTVSLKEGEKERNDVENEE
jgi:hypothetical protein